MAYVSQVRKWIVLQELYCGPSVSVYLLQSGLLEAVLQPILAGSLRKTSNCWYSCERRSWTVSEGCATRRQMYCVLATVLFLMRMDGVCYLRINRWEVLCKILWSPWIQDWAYGRLQWLSSKTIVGQNCVLDYSRVSSKTFVEQDWVHWSTASELAFDYKTVRDIDKGWFICVSDTVRDYLTGL